VKPGSLKEAWCFIVGLALDVCYQLFSYSLKSYRAAVGIAAVYLYVPQTPHRACLSLEQAAPCQAKNRLAVYGKRKSLTVSTRACQ
jgi:hypothetical protein